MFGATGLADNGDSMDLVVGQQQVLTLPGIKRVAIANPAIADVKALDGGDLLVSGVAPGKTELTLWQGEKILRYTITVSTANSPKQVADLLNSQLSQIGLPGARATAVGRTIFVERW